MQNALTTLLGTEHPLIQAPMAGVQGATLAVAVSNAGALGSLPCAMLTPEALQRELKALHAGTTHPVNLNFFCHVPPEPDAAREAAWRHALAPYYAEAGLDIAAVPAGAGRVPFSHDTANQIESFRPPVLSFHFGLPAPDLLARVKRWGSVVLSSATTVAEARWLAAHGADAIIAHVSMDETLHPGQVIGSGTVGNCCGLEQDRYLKSGDVVELEVEGIGILRNTVVSQA